MSNWSFTNYFESFLMIKRTRYVPISDPFSKMNFFLFVARFFITSFVFYVIPFAVLTTLARCRVIALSLSKSVAPSTVR